MPKNKQTFTPQELEDRRKKRADSFWGIFMPVKDGKIKSTLVVNSFSFSILCLAIYVALYIFLIDPLGSLVGADAPVYLENIVESIVPAILGTLICCSFHFVFKQKKIIPAAYAWLTVLGIGASIAVVVIVPADIRPYMLHLVLLCVPAPLITGCGLSAFLYSRYRKKELLRPPVEELPPWKRKKAKV